MARLAASCHHPVFLPGEAPKCTGAALKSCATDPGHHLRRLRVTSAQTEKGAFKMPSRGRARPAPPASGCTTPKLPVLHGGAPSQRGWPSPATWQAPKVLARRRPGDTSRGVSTGGPVHRGNTRSPHPPNSHHTRQQTACAGAASQAASRVPHRTRPQLLESARLRQSSWPDAGGEQRGGLTRHATDP